MEERSSNMQCERWRKSQRRFSPAMDLPGPTSPLSFLIRRTSASLPQPPIVSVCLWIESSSISVNLAIPPPQPFPSRCRPRSIKASLRREIWFSSLLWEQDSLWGRRYCAGLTEKPRLPETARRSGGFLLRGSQRVHSLVLALPDVNSRRDCPGHS